MPQGLDLVLGNLERWEQSIRDRLEAALTKLMLDFEAQAKEDHPYQDDSGLNTASIRGFVRDVTDQSMTGVLSAGMVYSKFLEEANGGKYAFLSPIIQRNRDSILPILAAAMKGVT